LTKLRVYEYAKQLDMSSKEIITILNRLNVEVNNHMSVMDQEMINQVEKFFSDVKSRAAARMENQSGGQRETDGARDRKAPEVRNMSASASTATAGRDSAAQVAPQTANIVNANPSANVSSIRQEPQAQPVRTDQSQQARVSSAPTGGQNASSHQRPQGNQNRQGEARPYQGSRDTRSGDNRSAPRGGASAQGGQGGGRPQGSTSSSTGQRVNRPPGSNDGRSSGPNRSGNAGGSGQYANRTQTARSNGSGSQPFGQKSTSTQGGLAGRGQGGRPANGKASNNPRTEKTGRTSDHNTEDRFDRNKRAGSKWSGDSRDSGRRGSAGRSGNRRQSQSSPIVEVPRKVVVQTPITVGELAKEFRKEASEVIKKLIFLGVMVTINQEIEPEAIILLASEFNIEVTVKDPIDENAEDMLIGAQNAEAMTGRPPVVTIMGHVDHGKTTLLDAIRETKVTATEAGGITQHIGAYQVEANEKKITFLDTPGHAAFTSMRARGAQVTDVTVLVVAADDGVMPQTVEAIHHAKAANVPILVAVNKMDKPGANPDRVKQELMEHGLVAEEWGGDTIFVPVSALKREGLDQLLEMIILVSEISELKADPTARPRGTVIEAKLDRGRGPVTTVLVQDGMLKIGDIVVVGQTFGRVRAMYNDHGRRVKEVGPSEPAEIIGLSDVPNAGDLFVVYDDERKARSLADKRTAKHRAETLGTHSRVTLDDLQKQIAEGIVKDLNVIIKGDVHGSVEAIVDALGKIDIETVRVRCLHAAVGAITESDVTLAEASGAIILGFNVRPETNAAKLADAQNVEIRQYRVIYDIINEIEAALKGMLDPVYKEVIVGRAEVRQTFKVSRIGTIAGCLVVEGKLVKNNEARVIRNGIVVHEGKLDSLKRFKDDVREVANGYECGVTFERFHDLKEGDIVEMYALEAVKVE